MTRVSAILITLAAVVSATAGEGDRVLVYVCDGLRPDAITADVAPRLFALQQQAAVAPEALCDLPTATLPNHVSLLTGLEAHRHGVLINTDIPGKVPYTTMFEVAAAGGLRASFYASKTKLGFVARETSLVRSRIVTDPASLVAQLIDDLPTDQPDLVFLHTREPDSTGHAQDWMSPAYLEAVSDMDALFGQVLDTLAADGRNTYVLVTADHGGFGPSHIFNTPTVRRIPWLVAGPDVAVGVLPEQVVTTDTMPTALMLLGLDVPVDVDGRARVDVLAGTSPATDAPIGPPCLVLPIGLLLLAWLRLRA